MSVEYRTPVECGRYDPTMQDWLSLPVGTGENQSVCPQCGSAHFGTINPTGYFLVRVCHDEHGESCHQQFRATPSVGMIAEIANALAGYGRRI